MDTLTFLLWLSFELTLIVILAMVFSKTKLAEKALSILGKIVGTFSDEDGEK